MLASLEQARAGERRFLADASHELRTPVTALLGNVDFAARHGADAEVLADLRHDAERLARLVDSLLVLERAGAPGGGVREPVALDELARSLAAERVVLGTVEAVRVSGDRAALARAVGNLVENGLVHGPANGVVRVSVTREGEHARLTVRDEGPGPDPAEHDQLFQRFWRGDGTSERPGAGLGLSIVAVIAAQHSGQVLVDGSSFTLELPVAD
jgi:two-component system OmpR family sensor kinase